MPSHAIAAESYCDACPTCRHRPECSANPARPQAPVGYTCAGFTPTLHARAQAAYDAHRAAVERDDHPATVRDLQEALIDARNHARHALRRHLPAALRHPASAGSTRTPFATRLHQLCRAAAHRRLAAVIIRTNGSGLQVREAIANARAALQDAAIGPRCPLPADPTPQPNGTNCHNVGSACAEGPNCVDRGRACSNCPCNLPNACATCQFHKPEPAPEPEVDDYPTCAACAHKEADCEPACPTLARIIVDAEANDAAHPAAPRTLDITPDFARVDAWAIDATAYHSGNLQTHGREIKAQYTEALDADGNYTASPSEMQELYLHLRAAVACFNVALCAVRDEATLHAAQDLLAAILSDAPDSHYLHCES